MHGHTARARTVATEAMRRTHPWSRSHADAASGMATVLMAEGDFARATLLLDSALRDRASLGALERLLLAQRADALFLSGGAPRRDSAALEALTDVPPDFRYRSTVSVADALSSHSVGDCHGSCRTAVSHLALEGERGHQLTNLEGMLEDRRALVRPRTPGQHRTRLAGSSGDTGRGHRDGSSVVAAPLLPARQIGIAGPGWRPNPLSPRSVRSRGLAVGAHRNSSSRRRSRSRATFGCPSAGGEQVDHRGPEGHRRAGRCASAS